MRWLATIGQVGFASQELHEGEDLISDTRPHWSLLVRSALQSALVLVSSVVVDLLYPNMPNFLLFALIGLIALALARFGVKWARWAWTRHILTTDRVVLRWGVLSRRGREIPLQRISDLGYRQSLWQRLVASGSVVVKPLGDGRGVTIVGVRRPASFHHSIWHQIERGRQLSASRQGATAPGLSIPEQIEKLDELRRRGLISNSEFGLKRDYLMEKF